MTLPIFPETPSAATPDVAARLHELYEQESRIYTEIQEISRRQAEAVRAGCELGSVRRLLEAKRNGLDRISRLEEDAAAAKLLWEQGRRGSPAATAKLQQALRRVSAQIEEILHLEAEIDRLVLEKAGGER